MAKVKPARRRGNSKLRSILGYRHGAQTEFAKRYNLSIGHVNNVLSGRRIANEKLTKLIERLASR